MWQILIIIWFFSLYLLKLGRKQAILCDSILYGTLQTRTH
ncbi:hypothetical protein HMPREF1562_2947 [Providencia alcalifaciens F90-2004]|uniref:Uncharacterized protein n=1 Tax=Providencia alcalifaciens DSM 30120 TaxID=520999 RepID=B6XFV7_9GAMM|nr:hypothetical protein PROVALCAL_02242 [Providencia alcalifaciens DSM 30120]ETT04113.1 hypothetical protein HMPREF1562_2947 [Providencia alcalifaciens F90-2004]